MKEEYFRLGWLSNGKRSTVFVSKRSKTTAGARFFFLLIARTQGPDLEYTPREHRQIGKEKSGVMGRMLPQF
jgi:hypothetical protein